MINTLKEKIDRKRKEIYKFFWKNSTIRGMVKVHKKAFVLIFIKMPVIRRPQSIVYYMQPESEEKIWPVKESKKRISG